MTDNEKNFLKVFGITMFAGYLGHLVDNTRFGIWFNTNPIIDVIWKFVGFLIKLAMIGFVLVFLYFLATG